MYMKYRGCLRFYAYFVIVIKIPVETIKFLTRFLESSVITKNG